jgi:superfamily II DNA or RNA helicase
VSEVKLRDYQREAVSAIRTAWNSGTRRPACVLPTGAGKTVVFSDLITRDLRDGTDRVLVLAHRDELIRQAVKKIKDVAPYLRVGVCKAGEDQVGAPVVVGSVQTMRNEARRRRVRNVGLVVVDECHHATADSYRAVLNHYGCFEEGGARAVGFTATMSRGDGVGLGQVWESVVYERNISYMITRGFLVQPRGVHVRVEDLDLGKLRIVAGDFSEGAMGEALAASMAPERIVDAYREHADGRPALLFVPTVAFAELMAGRFTQAGVSARVVHGGQGTDERRAALAAFSEGRVSVLVNCMVLTEGTDLPLASCVIIARPTTHVGLYVQMVGRVLRPYPGKTEAIVLDVVGVSRRHALAGLTDLIGERDALGRREADEEPADGQDLDLDESDNGSYVQRAWLDGTLVSEEVDLFHGQRARWQRTHAGHWFVAVGERFLAVIPSPLAGAWDVVTVDRTRVGVSDWVARGISDLGYAMAHAESVIGVREHSLAKRRAPWRGKPVSNDQARRLQRYGVADLSTLANQGAAADLMNVWDASTRIDPRVPLAVR